MKIKGQWFENRYCFIGLLISFLTIFMFMGCSTTPKEFDPNVTGPQMIVEPESIRLGIAKLKDTQILFKGKSFQPEDSVFIKLLNVRKGDQVMDLPIADGNVDKNGYFTAKVGIIPKINELLRAKLGSNKKMETIIIVTQPPIAEGVYTVKAVSMEADLTAECKLIVKDPSFFDKIKDGIGKFLGKIVEK